MKRFVNLTNTSGFISWICCCITYLRFRKAAKVQGIEYARTRDERRYSVSNMAEKMPYNSPLQPYGAWIAMVGFIILCLINGFTVFFPSEWSASNFLTAYVGIPIFLVLYFGHRIYARHDPWATKSEDVDMLTGMDEVLAAETPPTVYDKWWKKVKAAVE
jgi:yeast amino acid transporter